MFISLFALFFLILFLMVAPDLGCLILIALLVLGACKALT